MGGGGGSKTSTTTSGIAEEFIPYYEKALGIATNRLSGQFDKAGNLRDPSAAGIVAGLNEEQKQGLLGQKNLASDAMTGRGIYNDMGSAQAKVANEALAGRGVYNTMGSPQAKMAQQAMAGEGVFNNQQQVQRMLQNASGAQDYARQGALGSARGDRAQQAALADMGYQFNQGNQASAMAGADMFNALQQQRQRNLEGAGGTLFGMQEGMQRKAESGAQSMRDVGSTLQEQSQRVLDAPYTELQRYSNIAFGNAPQQSTTSQTGGK